MQDNKILIPLNRKSSGELVLGANALNTMESVQVLVEDNLVASSTTLARDNARVGKEEFPDAKPPVPILGLNLLAVCHPVSVPPPESSAVVNSDSINALNFETSTLEFINEPTKRSRSISTGEYIFVHKQSPNEVLELPRLSQTSDLQEQGSIILEHVVNLIQERSKVSDADVFGHFQASDLIIFSSGHGSITVIHAQNFRLRFLDSITAEARVSPCGLVATEGDTGNVSAIALGSEASESAPSTAKIEHTVTILEINFLTNDLELVVLELFERLLLVDVGNKTGSVDHAWAQEPTIKVITTVVMITDLFLILRAGVHKQLRNHAQQKVLEKTLCKLEIGPVVTVFKNFQAVSLEGNIALKIHFIENFHRNLSTTLVFHGILLLVELEIVLNTLSRELDFLILPRRIRGHDNPEPNQDRKIHDQGEKQKCLESTANLVLQVVGDAKQESKHEHVGPGVVP